MSETEFQVVADGLSFLEGPRWHDGRLFVSDFYTLRVYSVTPDGAVETVVEVPQQPSGLGWLPDGTMLVVSMKDRRVLRLENGRLVEHADLSGIATGHCNDMVVDTQGRAYVGNFGFDLMGGEAMASTNLVRVDPDGSATVVAKDMHFPNGTVITPDGRTLIISESFGNRVSAFDVEPDGSLSNRRVWASFGEPPAATDLHEAIGQVSMAPDGMCLDAEGCIWVADALGNRVLRVREGGEVVAEISTGEYGVFACMLGGDDGRTLFLCCAPTFAEDEAKANHRARLMSCPVGVPHAGLP